MKVFFDVDGVLIHGFHADPEFRLRWDENLKRDFGIDINVLTQVFFRGPFQDVIIGKRDLYDAIKEVSPKIGYDGDPQILVDYWFENDRNLSTQVMQVVEKLSRSDEIELYIATNQEPNRARYLWEEVGFKSHFRKMFYSAALGCVKADPNYFRQINKELGISPEDTVVFFDDTEENVHVAISEGWRAYHFKTADDLHKSPEIAPYL